jgi:rod shape determining protein RodA
VSGNEAGYDRILVASVILVILGSFFWMLIKGKRMKIYGALFFILSSVMIYSADHIYHNVIKSHHRDRIEDMLGIKVDIKDAGYNVYQSKVAIGSGGLTGKGFMQGTQTKLNFVPEQSTDFIFCTIGEEWGFRGSFVVILMFAVMLIRLIILAERQKTVFSRMYGYGVAMIILFHFTINIGMTIGLAPVVGIPLPYMSAGGSSLLSFTILLFVFLKLESSSE